MKLAGWLLCFFGLHDVNWFLPIALRVCRRCGKDKGFVSSNELQMQWEQKELTEAKQVIDAHYGRKPAVAPVSGGVALSDVRDLLLNHPLLRHPSDAFPRCGCGWESDIADLYKEPAAAPDAWVEHVLACMATRTPAYVTQ